MKRDWRAGTALLLLVIGVGVWLSYTEDYAFFRAAEAARMNGMGPFAPVWCFADCPSYPSDLIAKWVIGAAAFGITAALLVWSFFRPRD